MKGRLHTTNPRIVKERVLVEGKLTDILNEKATFRLRNREPLTNEEINLMLKEADSIEQEYFRLRVKALISLVKKFGKRRSEIAILKREDLKIQNGKLLVTFTLRKKHKKGLFQYLRWLEKENSTDLQNRLQS